MTTLAPGTGWVQLEEVDAEGPRKRPGAEVRFRAHAVDAVCDDGFAFDEASRPWPTVRVIVAGVPVCVYGTVGEVWAAVREAERAFEGVE